MLNNKDKKYLRSLGMNIEPIVQVGKNGVNESVLFSLNEALTARELVKIKVLKNCFEEICKTLADGELPTLALSRLVSFNTSDTASNKLVLVSRTLVRSARYKIYALAVAA